MHAVENQVSAFLFTQEYGVQDLGQPRLIDRAYLGVFGEPIHAAQQDLIPNKRRLGNPMSRPKPSGELHLDHRQQYSKIEAFFFLAFRKRRS